LSEKFKARGTNSPDATSSLPPGVDGLRYLNEKEVAALIGFAVQSLRNWRFLGREPGYIKMGRSVRYQLKDVLEWMESHRIEPRK
jgi:predicted DNA-binding transcriptional regulator AlpA